MFYIELEIRAKNEVYEVWARGDGELAPPGGVLEIAAKWAKFHDLYTSAYRKLSVSLLEFLYEVHFNGAQPPRISPINMAALVEELLVDESINTLYELAA